MSSYLWRSADNGALKSFHFKSKKKKVEEWKSKLRSFGGKVVLFRHVLNSMPVYLLSAMSIPKEGMRRLEQTFANLLWGETEGRKKDHWVAWHKVCRSVREGELGIRSLEIIDKAFRCKMLLKFISGSGL